MTNLIPAELWDFRLGELTRGVASALRFPVIAGPTAGGKSALAVEVALLLAARGTPGEIVSAENVIVHAASTDAPGLPRDIAARNDSPVWRAMYPDRPGEFARNRDATC